MGINYKLISPAGNPVEASPGTSETVPATWAPSLRCPHCMQMGTFRTVHKSPVPSGKQNDIQIEISGDVYSNKKRELLIVGIRLCPNIVCLGLVFVLMSNDGTLSFPPELLDFDPSDVPVPIAKSLEEAIQCHSARCYRAAALMVRRVLEELCDERGANGDDLKARLRDLGKVIVVPINLMEAADHLRLLGNDAAHIKATTYDSIGETEVRLAIDLTKELLKATYQYGTLVDRLKKLQKQ